MEEKHLDEAEAKLNRYDLAVEAEKSAGLLQTYGKERARIQNERDKLSLALKRVEAEKDLHYRASPPEGVKITEAVVKALVETDPEVIKAGDALLAMEGALGRYINDVDVIRMKNDNVKIEKDLWIGGYFANE